MLNIIQGASTKWNEKCALISMLISAEHFYRNSWQWKLVIKLKLRVIEWALCEFDCIYASEQFHFCWNAGWIHGKFNGL